MYFSMYLNHKFSLSNLSIDSIQTEENFIGRSQLVIYLAARYRFSNS